MPGTFTCNSAEQYTAIHGFAITGNPEKSTIEPNETFLLSAYENKFGAGRRMCTVYDLNGNTCGYVTSGQAELIRRGEA